MLNLFGASTGWNGKISIDQATVALSARTWNNPLEILSSAILQAAGSSSSVTLNGPMSGTGNLTYGEGNHVVLGDNVAFDGLTTIGPGFVDIRHANGLGSDAVGTIVNASGQLTIRQSTSEPITLQGGSLSLLSGSTSHGIITLDGGRPLVRGGKFEGQIVGQTNRLQISATEAVHLNATNTYEGATHIYFNSGSGVVEANNAHSLGGSIDGTLVHAGTLNMHVATEEPIVVNGSGVVNLNVQQRRLPRLFTTDTANPSGLQSVAVNVPSVYDELVDVVEGKLAINADTTIRGATVRSGGQIAVASDKTLYVQSQEIQLMDGTIQGQISGPTTLRKTTGNNASLADLPGFTGDIVVEQGLLEIKSSNALGTTAGNITVSGTRQAVIHISNSMTIGDDIFLQNASGIDDAGAIFIGPASSGGSSTVVTTGLLDLGTYGSIIGSNNGESSGTAGILQTMGPIVGGSLTTTGRHLIMQIQNGSNTYAGLTDIRAGRIELAGNGTLSSTSGIILHEAPGSYESKIVLDNTTVSID